MKVVAKRTVFDRIMEDIHKLQREDREVEYVVVTEEESEELRKDLRTLSHRANEYMFARVSDMPMTATFKTWEFPRTGNSNNSRRDFRGHRVIRVTNMGETFHGVPLLVVPSDFHPK